jgi:hypothetical protein
MGAKDIVAECAQTLRGSSFEYEQLLGTSVERVWHGIARSVERSLLAKRGISVPGLGKFGFYKDLPHALVFLLADRFMQSHSGISWRNKPPPAPLAVTSDLSMAVLGSEVGLARDQTQQSLDELLRFIGRKLGSGSASDRLAVGGVGSFTFEGRALSFGFDSSFVKRASEVQGRKEPSAIEALLSSGRRRPKQKISSDNIKQALQRSASLNGQLEVDPTSGLSGSGGGHIRSAVEIRLEDDKAAQSNMPMKKKRHHHKHNHDSQTAGLPSSAKRDTGSAKNDSSDPVPRILPRFLLPEPSIPVKSRHSRANHDLVTPAAFEREKARLAGLRQQNDRYNREFEARQQATQLQTLQQRAEKIVGQRSLNAFLNYQIGDKHERQRQHSASLEAAVDPGSVTILPRDRTLSEDAKREQKQKLSKRLNDQVDAKTALKRDGRVVDQAEMAYFISQLDAHALKEAEETLAHKRLAKQELLADWTQQLHLRALQKELAHSR